MTPNKLPPLPERKPGVDRLWDTQWMNIVNHADCWRTFTKEDAVAQAVLMTEQKMAENFRALRQSQSLPAGAVAGLVGKWRDSSAFETDGYSILHRFATELEQALQADAREKGEADVTDAMVWRAVNANHGSARVGNLIDDTDPFAVMRTGLVAALATQPAQASEKDNG